MEPNFTCSHCGKPIYRKNSAIERNKNKIFFCSKECQIAEQRIGGKLVPTHYGTASTKLCLYCGKIFIPQNKGKFCSIECSKKYMKQTAISKWFSGEWDGTIPSGKISGTIRNYLLDKFLDTCSNCGNKTWMGETLPLEVHHKDGNKRNNKLENLEILCPNCHSLTDTYKSKNIKKKNV